MPRALPTYGFNGLEATLLAFAASLFTDVERDAVRMLLRTQHVGVVRQKEEAASVK